MQRLDMSCVSVSQILNADILRPNLLVQFFQPKREARKYYVNEKNRSNYLRAFPSFPFLRMFSIFKTIISPPLFQ